MQKKLIITLGDPYSVNIELVNLLLKKYQSDSYDITLVGSAFHWKDQVGGFAPEHLSFQNIEGTEKRASSLSIKERGEIAVNSLLSLKSYLQTTQDKVAILTCPIDKHAAQEAGFEYPGHTEFFTHTSACDTLMLLAGPRLRVALATQHLALKDVSTNLKSESIYTKLQILYKTLQNSFHIRNPKIAV